MSSSMTEGLLLGIPEIAEIAEVGRNAVSNWRKRHSDFPTPAVETPSGLLFDVGDVEKWLIENGKIARRIPAASLLWSALDALRSELEPREIEDFVTAVLVYLEVSERVTTRVFDDVDLEKTWRAVREDDPSNLASRLVSAAKGIEQSHPEVAGLMTKGFHTGSHLNPTSIRRVLDLFDRSTNAGVGGYSRAALFEEARDRNHELSRFSAAIASPAAVEHLLARLASGARSIFDPACGEAGSLLLAGQVQSFEFSSGDSPVWPYLVGWDINERACDLACARFFVYGVDEDADISHRDGLREEPPRDMDVVIADPPYGLKDWGDADLYTSERWTYGAPPPNCGDFAWIQVALEALAFDGRAYVILPAGSLFRGGREEEIRAALIKAGVVEAIVLLPARLRRDTSIPLVLWCLRSPEIGREFDEILMVDASRLGTTGRSTVTLDQEELDAILMLLLAWGGSRKTDVDDPRIEVTLVPVDDLDGANLDPSHYRKAEAADISALLAERQIALAHVLSAHEHASRAMADLINQSGASHD